MWRDLFVFSQFHVRSYGVAHFVALIVIWVGVWAESRRGPEEARFPWNWAALIYLMTILGAELTSIGLNRLLPVTWLVGEPWNIGFSYYGGVTIGLLTLLLYLRRRKMPVWHSCDLIVPYVALGEAVVRIGCFLNGCCFGTQTLVPWAVIFPRRSFAWYGQLWSGQIASTAPCALPVHPTQLYYALWLVALFVGLRYALRRQPVAGFVFLTYCGFHGLMRLLLDVLRGDNHAILAGLGFSQLIAVVLCTVGFGGCVLLMRKRRRETTGS